MRTKAAIIREPGQSWEITELELDEPRQGEVRIKFVPIEDGIPFEVAALTGCGVPTGWGTAVYAAGVRAGETVVIFGAGGVGSNAVQGAVRGRRERHRGRP